MTSHPSPVTRHLTLVLIGAKGMLAQAILKTVPACYEVHCYDLPDFDLTDNEQVLATVKRLQPQIIINCAAYTNVDGCESAEAFANRVNGEGPGNLARAAKAIDATLVHISTDYVFDGLKTTPYTEADMTGPQSAYGRSKLAGEQAIIGSGLKKYYIIRTSWLYGPGGNNFVETMIRLATEREELRVVADQIGSPTYTHDLAEAIFNLLSLVTRHPSPVTAPYGLYNFSNDGACSWYDFAVEIIRIAGRNGLPIKAEKIHAISTEDYPLPATRPAYSVFSKNKYKSVTGKAVPDWQESLEKYMKDRF